MGQVMTTEPYAVSCKDIQQGHCATLQFHPTGQSAVEFIEKPPTGGWDSCCTLTARRRHDGKLVLVHFNDRGLAYFVEDLPDN